MQKIISWLSSNGFKSFLLSNLPNLKILSSLIEETECNGTIYVFKHAAKTTATFSKFTAISFHKLLHLMFSSYSKANQIIYEFSHTHDKYYIFFLCKWSQLASVSLVCLRFIKGCSEFMLRKMKIKTCIIKNTSFYHETGNRSYAKKTQHCRETNYYFLISWKEQGSHLAFVLYH